MLRPARDTGDSASCAGGSVAEVAAARVASNLPRRTRTRTFGNKRPTERAAVVKASLRYMVSVCERRRTQMLQSPW